MIALKRTPENNGHRKVLEPIMIEHSNRKIKLKEILTEAVLGVLLSFVS